MALIPFVSALSYAEFIRTDLSAFLRILLADKNENDYHPLNQPIN